jgi:hypothetical protein
MKRIILYLFFLCASFTAFGQNTEAQNLTLINIVRNNTLSPARVANALDAINYSKQGLLQAYTAAGTDTYTVTGPTAITSYASGQLVFVTFTNANTGAATLNINSIGAADIKSNSGAALSAGDLVAGATYILKHNGTHFRIVGASGSGGSSYTFSNGLTESGGAAKLGGDITENTIITSTGGYNLWIGNLGGSDALGQFRAYGNSVTIGSQSFSSTNGGELALTSSNSYLHHRSTSNNQTSSLRVNSGIGASISRQDLAANNATVSDVLLLTKGIESGTYGANGVGARLAFTLPTNTAAQNTSDAGIEYSLTDVTNTAPYGKFVFKTNNGNRTTGTTVAELSYGSLKVPGLSNTSTANVLKYNTSDGSVTYSPVPKVVQVAFSDQSSAITAGTNKITFRMPYAMTVTEVRVSLRTAQTSGSIFTVDLNEAGTTILSTKATVDNTEKTSTTAATAPVISDSSLADDAEMTVDVDLVGDGTAVGGVITIIGY